MLVICFWFLLCLGCSLVIIGDTYVVYWFSGCCLFIGSLVRRLLACCCLAQVCEFEVLGLQLGLFVLARGLLLVVFFCLLRLCRVGVLRRQLELFFFHFAVFRSCTRKWTCGSVVCHVWRSRDLAPVPCPPILLLNFAPILFPSSGPYLHVFLKCSCRRKGY
jgi:hypothetical protein